MFLKLDYGILRYINQINDQRRKVMIKTCRLSIPYSETESMESMAEKELAKVGLKIDDVKIDIISKEDWSTHTHFGNWVLTPILYLSVLNSLIVDMKGYILEDSDIERFQIGQKIRIQYTNGLAGQTFDEGTIYFKGEEFGTKFIAILKKGTKSGKGWKFYSGDCAAIFER